MEQGADVRTRPISAEHNGDIMLTSVLTQHVGHRPPGRKVVILNIDRGPRVPWHEASAQLIRCTLTSSFNILGRRHPVFLRGTSAKGHFGRGNLTALASESRDFTKSEVNFWKNISFPPPPLKQKK